MTLGQKLKEIRKRFGLSQEQFAEIMNVSRQAITKWENDGGLPDVSNLQELSKVFGITVDYLLNDENQLPALSMRKELDREKYKNKLTMYSEVLKEYYPEPYEIYILTRTKKLNFIELILDIFIAPEIGPVSTADEFGNLSPYYLVKKDNLKLLVNIKNYVMEVIELPSNTNDKKFVYGQNKFRNCGKLKLLH
ncbi:MAG: helix-turn-helix transcriptional regulator [Bacilli bacterium]|nr:helix-turn-helix transcriptional regulator [Bacilli bacterium]